MNGDRYEFGAIPLVAGILGVLFLVFAGAALGLGWFVTLGFAFVVAAAAVAYVVTRGHARSSERERPVAVAHDPSDGAYRVLVVTHTCLTAALAEELAARSAGRRAEAFVIAPRAGSRLAQWTGDESAYAAAQEHLELTLDALSGAGLDAHGQVGPLDPLQALDDGLREFPADEVVFAAASAEGADAFEQRVLDAARTHYAGPVSSVVVDATA